ncbi:NADPH-dependent F420 reductase [Patulibacter defluvii]|uniref:NADPH-dependent F420 reductase n=1 Tax=Patulibacter defluvii TaxID=3095358 RepID=UPI0035C90571
MRIGILGTGTMAAALGAAWAARGHGVTIGGRSEQRARALAERLGAGVGAATPREAVAGRDAVLLAVLWEGVEEILRQAGGPEGALAGTPLIDCTNAVEHGVGVLLPAAGTSAAERVAALAPGAQVVKALHLFPSSAWTTPRAADEPGPTVAICGDEPAALDAVAALIGDLGGRPAVLGPLARARQLEEVAGFVIGLAFSGVDPASAVPGVAG